jgi:hypothetical protein
MSSGPDAKAPGCAMCGAGRFNHYLGALLRL